MPIVVARVLFWPSAANLKRLIAGLGLLLLAACTVVPQGHRQGSLPPAPRSKSTIYKPPVAKPTYGAALARVRPGPPAHQLGLGLGNARAALTSFITSCPRLTRRADSSGLTRPQDWQPACNAARNWPADDADGFFHRWFETAEVAGGDAFVTGYYEPEIAGVRTRQPGFNVPVYARPTDLVRAHPGDAAPLSDGKMPLGRYDDDGRFVSYYDRAAIEDGALAGRGLEIAWVADPVEFFFLQIQGSGRLRAPDGSIMRIGFAGQNGYAYTGIGTVLKDRGVIGSGPGKYPGSMQGLMQYLRENPRDGREVMRGNRSYVFFREITGDGPVGALGVPVRGRSTVAADPAYVPLGAPVWLEVDHKHVNGLWVAQDTGGAIKGANRFDSFWGAGPEARRIAGGMSGRGRALIFLPKGTLERLGKR